ncbi:hypothetical protein LENED_000372 [Lentinula edodes]|uniref:Uncharacterized protein n=1 Tax=Lentinula edodes TaxID=5353 RepID=A0A1Q3DVI6_LENED|nr:hypothetical protein LENED_000372 [Lentinula edodes]
MQRGLAAEIPPKSTVTSIIFRQEIWINLKNVRRVRLKGKSAKLLPVVAPLCIFCLEVSVNVAGELILVSKFLLSVPTASLRGFPQVDLAFFVTRLRSTKKRRNRNSKLL